MQDRGEQTRQRLLEATISVLLERGWGGVTTRVVADRAGVKAGLVHYHFGSIDDLRREAITRTFEEISEPFIEIGETMRPMDLVDAIAEVSTGEYAPGTDISNLMYEVLPATTRDSGLQAFLADVLDRFRGVLADSIRRHHPNALVEPDILAELIAAAIDGLQLHLLADPKLDLRAHLHALLPLLGPAAHESPTTALDTEKAS